MSIMLNSILQGRITNYNGISKMGEINLSVIIRNDTNYGFFFFFFITGLCKSVLVVNFVVIVIFFTVLNVVCNVALIVLYCIVIMLPLHSLPK